MQFKGTLFGSNQLYDAFFQIRYNEYQTRRYKSLK